MLKATFKIVSGNSTWENITGNPEDSQSLVDFVDTKLSAFGGDIEQELNALEDEVNNLSDRVSDNYIELDGKISDNATAINNHIADKTNPHEVTKAQVGLGNVDNTSDLNKPISTATQTALDGKVPNTRTVNNKALSSNISLNYSDVGALPSSTTINDLTTEAQQNALNSTATLAKINQIATNAGAIEEITASLSALGSSLSLEALDRENADINLQQQIDAITSASDVTDIVGTYAQLQAYDTSTLPNNSIIKVLQDESQNDETTYYRWVITGGVGAWVLIGEEGPYYTKSQADSTFVPQTRTVNNKALSSNITLSASDVGAATSAQGTKADTAIQSVTTGSANGTISVDGTDVSVYGLGSAAYTNSTAYATSSQGTKADTALQQTDIVSSVDSSSTNTKAVGAKLFYDTCGDIETLINAL